MFRKKDWRFDKNSKFTEIMSDVEYRGEAASPKTRDLSLSLRVIIAVKGFEKKRGMRRVSFATFRKS